MAATLWGEARGETYEGKLAIAHVIMNRLKKPGWWSRSKDDVPDDTVAAVCVDPAQFTCWHDGQAARVRDRAKNPDLYMGEFAFRSCLRAALAVLDTPTVDPTSGATHYHTAAILPGWAKTLSPCAAVGSHLFYNNVR